MLEIFFVIWFIAKAGSLAESKGRSKVLFRVTAFLLWAAWESVGILVAVGRAEAGLVAGPAWFFGLMGALMWWGIASSLKARAGSSESEANSRAEDGHSPCQYCNARVPLGAKRCPICAGDVETSSNDSPGEGDEASAETVPNLEQEVDRSRCKYCRNEVPPNARRCPICAGDVV